MATKPKNRASKPVKTGEIQVRGGGKFQKGESGNPNGRPVGSRNKTTVAVGSLLDGDAEALTGKAIEKAKEGDMAALRLCLDRIIPPRKDRPVTFEMPAVNSAKDVVDAIASLLGSVSKGEITPSEAGEVSKIFDVYVRALEVNDLAARIDAMERAAQ
jgi:Family of unknown function (DUF5681)